MEEWYNTRSQFPDIEESFKENIEEDLTSSEINKVMFDMSHWKSLGLDDFPACFFQKSWSMVGNKVSEFAKKLWRNSSNVAKVNQTDLCLILKVCNPQLVTQFRPISLCNTIYKLLSKI